MSDSSLARTSSWVVVDKICNKAVFETYKKETVELIKSSCLKKYKVIPILEWLQNLNSK